MRKPIENRFILVTNAKESNVKLLLTFTIDWLSNHGMEEDRAAGMKCAVCEALSNVIDHAYDENFTANSIEVDAVIYKDGTVKVAVRDEGKGISDINVATETFFTTGDPEKHSGMGFTTMRAFVDRVKVRSEVGKGTNVLLFHTLTKTSAANVLER